MKTATLANPTLPVITSTIGVLSDRELLRQTTTLVRHERHLHVDPHMTVGQLVGRIVQEALDRHDPSRPPRNPVTP